MSDNSKDVMAIVDLFEQSDWDELHIELDGLHLFLSRRADAQLASGIGSAPAAVPAPVAAGGPGAVAPATAPVASVEAPAADPGGDVPDNWVAVTAPNLGTFYRAPKPGAPPFVEVGQAVSEDTELCLLEVMKLFTAVKAGVAGKIAKICADDKDMVEHGQPLFYIEKA